MSLETLTDLLVLAMLGGLVGVGELISRYRDSPWEALKCGSATLYVALNASASTAAYGLTLAFAWNFGLEPGSDELRWTRVLITGFGAMALFRSSLFVIRAGGQDVAIGPSSLLSVLLAAADRDVDRERGKARANEVRSLLEHVTWDRAKADLPALCLGLMQNATLEEQKALAGAVRDIEDGDLNEDVQVYLLGLELLNLAGIGVLRGAVGLLATKRAR